MSSRDGWELLDIDPDWKVFAAELEAGLARAEGSGFVPELLDQIWSGLQEGMFGGDATRPRAMALQHALYAWSLRMGAGSTLEESIAPLLPSIPDPEVRATFERLKPDDFVQSLGGVFTLAMIAMLRKSYECGNMARAMPTLAQELRRGTLSPRYGITP